MQMLLHRRQRIMGASPATEPERGGIEVRLEYGFQNDFQGHLHQSVFERRNAKRPELSRLARLRDQPLAHKLGSVVSVVQFLSDVLKKPFHTAVPLFDLAPRHPVSARCPAPRVAGEPLPSMAERAAITYQIEHVREPLVGIRVTPPVQLALHVEDERGIRRAGPHRPTSCWHSVPTAPPSPCGRLSRPRTTTEPP